MDGPISLDYFTDALLRPSDSAASNSQDNVRAQATRILARSLTTGEISADDQSYLVKVIAQRAGVDENTAKRHLDQVEEQVKQAAQ